jgi:hypothetical protein
MRIIYHARVATSNLPPSLGAVSHAFYLVEKEQIQDNRAVGSPFRERDEPSRCITLRQWVLSDRDDVL